MLIFASLISPSPLPRWRYNRAIRALAAQGVYIHERDDALVVEMEDDSVLPLDVIDHVERELGVKLELNFTS